MTSSDNSLNLSYNPDFETSLIDGDFSELNPIDLDSIKTNLATQNLENLSSENLTSNTIESTTTTQAQVSEIPQPLTVMEEIDMFNLNEPIETVVCADSSSTPDVAPHDPTSDGMDLDPTPNNTENQDVNVMTNIQSGGGSSPPNNLKRGDIIKISGKDENYIVSQIKDVYYDSDLEKVLKNYGIRKISLDCDNIGEVSGNIIDINSSQIIENKTIDEIDELTQDMINYKNEDSKAEDNQFKEQFQTIEFDPNLEEDEPDVNDDDMAEYEAINSLPLENTLDDEGFDFEEIDGDGIVLEVVQELAESKILFTEMEQEEDIIEEMIRTLPKRKRNDKNALKDIIDQVRLFRHLKEKYSKSYKSGYDLDDHEYNVLKQELLIKGRNYKPLINKYLNNEYHTNLIPIISTEHKKYEDIGNNVRKNIITGKRSGDDVDYIKELDDLNNIYKKYKTDSQLDYDNKSKEINNLLRSSEPRITNNFYSTFVQQDTNTLDNFGEVKKIKTNKSLGKDYWIDERGEEHVSIPGDNIYINGFMIKKEDEIQDFVFRRTALNKYIQPNMYSWTIPDEEILVSEIDSSSVYKKSDKVKVCIKDNNESIEVVGTVKSVRRNFIYVVPDDKSLLSDDNQILEFDTESKSLRIDKINEIKNPEAYCFNDSKYNIYLFNQDQQKLSKKNIKNILEQIVPSIYQIIQNSNLETITFNEEINRLLMNHNVSYSDMEFSNYQVLKKTLTKNITKIQKTLGKKYEKFDALKRTYNKLEAQEVKKNLERDFELLTNDLLDEINKVYEDYEGRPFSFDNEIERTRWVMNQKDYGKFFAFTLKDREIKSKKLAEKKDVLLAHKAQLQEEASTIQQNIEEEVRKNDFFQNPNSQCKEGIVSKISKIYLSISKLDEDNFKDIPVDPQYKTILEDEMVKPGDYCILKNSENPTISPEMVDMGDRIFERVVEEDGRHKWNEKSKGFLADYIREYKKLCQEKGDECKFTNSFGPCEPEKVKRLKQNKKENEAKMEIINKRILEIDEKRQETQIENSLKYYRGRELLTKQNRAQQKKLNQDRMDSFRKSINLVVDEEKETDYTDIQRLTQDLANPQKREELLALLQTRYGIDSLDMERPSTRAEETEMGDFNEAGQRMVFTESMDDSGQEDIPMTNNEVVDLVRSYLSSSTQEEGLSLDDDLDTVQKIIQVFLKIFGITLNTKTIEFKVLSIFSKNFISLKGFKKQYKKKGDVLGAYNKKKKQNLIYFTSAILLVELQIRLNNYFMSFYEKCVSSIDGYPVIPKEDEDKVGDRFNYGINFIVCILGNLKKGGSFWSSISDDNKKIKKTFKEALEVVLKERDIQNRLARKREILEQQRRALEEVEQNYSWNEYRPYLKQVGPLREPPDMDLNDCKLENKVELMKALRLADDRSKWYSSKIFEKINSIVLNENIENIKYDPLPIGNSCCLDTVNGNYNYYNFFFEKDSSNELKEFMEQSAQIEMRCKNSDYKLIYVKPSSIRPKLKSFAGDIFPKMNDINKGILSKVSLNYVGEGSNVGKKRIFKKYFIREGEPPIEIDVLTNDNKKDISSDRTEESFFGLVGEIHNRNKVDDPISIELVTDMTRFKLELVTNYFKHCYDNSVFMEDDFFSKLVGEYSETILNGSMKDVKRIWDTMSEKKNIKTRELLSNFGKKKNNQDITKILENLNNYEKSDEVDRANFDDDSYKLEINKRREKMLKGYFSNYLNKFVSLLANKKIKSMLTESEFDDYKFLTSFVKSKYRKVFRQIRDFTRTLTKFKCMSGFDDIKDCEGNTKEKSRFNLENCVKLLELTFIQSLIFIINDSLGEDVGDDSSNEDDDTLFTDEKSLRLQFVQTLLKKIDEDRKTTDKYNAKNNITEINKLNESNKDRNLKVMQLLDLETRRLRNEQTKAGLKNYADLSQDFSEVLERDELSQQVRARLGEDATDEQVNEELNRMMVDREEFSQRETFNTAEGDDEMEDSSI